MILLDTHTLLFIHRDPFDRLLICHANYEKCTLVTADTIIPEYDVETFW